MGHTLDEMGIQLRPIDWSRVVERRRSSQDSTPTSSPSQSPQASSEAVRMNSLSSESSPSGSEENIRLSPPASPPGVYPVFPVQILRPQTIILAQKETEVERLSGVTFSVKLEPQDDKTDVTDLREERCAELTT